MNQTRRQKVVNAFDGIWYVLSEILKSVILFFVPKTWRTKDVNGDIVVITGAGSGIGRLMAVDLAQRGAEVIVCDVNIESVDETRDLIRKSGGKSESYHCDVSNRQSVYSFAKKVKTEVGTVTILINNAGVLSGSYFLDLSDHKIEKTFAVNVLGAIWMCKAFLPEMIKANNGHIVTISSLGGAVGCSKLSDYCASKHALTGFDECLKMELSAMKVTGVHTTIVFPTFFRSNLYSGYESSTLVPQMSAQYVAKQIMLALLTNQETAHVPGRASLVLHLKMFMPIKAFIKLIEVCGGLDTIKSLKGSSEAVFANKNTIQ